MLYNRFAVPLLILVVTRSIGNFSKLLVDQAFIFELSLSLSLSFEKSVAKVCARRFVPFSLFIYLSRKKELRKSYALSFRRGSIDMRLRESILVSVPLHPGGLNNK